MDKLDQLITEALEDEDRVLFAQTEPLGWFALGANQFRGKLGWVTWVIMVVQTTLFIIGVWCAFHFFNATEIIPALKWGFSGSVILLTGLGMKLSLMPQIQADRVLRELKRVELLLAARGE